jgi:hypothetical protein
MSVDVPSERAGKTTSLHSASDEDWAGLDLATPCRPRGDKLRLKVLAFGGDASEAVSGHDEPFPNISAAWAACRNVLRRMRAPRGEGWHILPPGG